MSFAPAQPVGGRTRFPPPHTMTGRNELITPTRQPNAYNTLRRAAFRAGDSHEIESYANPFSPRTERGASPGGSRTLGRRNTTLGTATHAGRRRSGLYDSILTGTNDDYRYAAAPLRAQNALVDNASSNDPTFGGVGAWPSDTHGSGTPFGSLSRADRSSLNSAPGVSQIGTSPFSRPKSPGPRPASPRQPNKQLPSFLLGSIQQPKVSGRGSSFANESVPLQISGFGMGQGLGSSGSDLISRPAHLPTGPSQISPRALRRLSSFGSNDMLSNTFSSSPTAGGTVTSAAVLGDAPPVLTLDDINMDNPSSNVHDGIVHGGPGAFPSSEEIDSYDKYARSQEQIDAQLQNEAEQDYNDVKIRSVAIYCPQKDSDSSILNHFRNYGDVLAFCVVPDRVNCLALLYAEPWQAQRALAQGNEGGRILVGNRILVTIEKANDVCVDKLYAIVFPGHELPRFAAQSVDPNSFAQSIYSASPRPTDRTSRAIATPEPPMRSAGRPIRGTPFKPRSTSTMYSSNGKTAQNGTSRENIIKQPSAPKARNGFLQSAIDILFGW